jgi:hypothetical protein
MLAVTTELVLGAVWLPKRMLLSALFEHPVCRMLAATKQLDIIARLRISGPRSGENQTTQ